MKCLLKNCFTVESEKAERLDKFLVIQFPSYSRTYFQYLIDAEAVCVNGAVTKKRMSPKIGDRIEVKFLPLEEVNLIPESIPLDVLFEDEHLLCVNKPAGMVVHPSPGHPKGTFVHAILHHCQGNLLPGKEHRPGIVHRLDRETSGVLIAAKSSDAYQKLINQFKNREIEKEYMTITVGHPNACKIDAPIGRNPSCRKQMTVLKSGKEALTIIEPLKRGNHFSLISASLLTGRTHQIRVHLKHNQTPILGDSTYGIDKINKKFGVKRQLLHAYRIKLSHPIKDQNLNFVAPLPHDMQKIMRNFFSSP